MFSLITGKIKTAVIVVLSLALPVIYLLGRIGGGTRAKNNVLKDELDAAHKQTDFYKAMQEHEADIQSTAPRDRSSLIERLRRDGL